MNKNIKPYSGVIIRLLQGPVYNDNQELWNTMLSYQTPLRDYFSIINITLLINENEGFAFLTQQADENDDTVENTLPDLFIKRQLSYPVTILCILLVERLIEFDRTAGDVTFLIISREQMIHMMKTFLTDKSNETKLVDSIDANINKLVEYGFLKKLKNDKNEYEVRRILKAKINAGILSEILEKLKEYESESAQA